MHRFLDIARYWSKIADCNLPHLYLALPLRVTSLINSYYVLRAMVVIKVSNKKVTLKVIQGHWQWCHSIGYIRCPISLPLQLCLYLAPFLRYYHIFQNLKRSRHCEDIPVESNISCMHSYSSVSISTRNLKCLTSPITKI